MRLSWIANTLSFGNFFCGFLSIISSAVGSFSADNHYYYVYATLFIMMAALFDTLDGRIARRINQPNPLGKDLDSFADLVTFGLAPAFMFFFMFFGNEPYYKSPISESYVFGSLFSFLFPLFSALRLARFNVYNMNNSFSGLPSPIAGGSAVMILNFPNLPEILPVEYIIDYIFGLTLKIALPWWFVTFLFVFYASLMGSKFIFEKTSPSFMNFARHNSFADNFRSALYLLCLILLFKYFLLVYSLFYTFKPIITFKRFKD